MFDKKKTNFENRINEEIPYWYKTVRVVGEGIKSEVVTLNEAKKMANDMELDLIEINPNSNPPILKIANYEKMQYEAKKIAKKNAKQKQDTKEIQLSANIAVHDLETKVNSAKKFIEKGDNVRIVLTLRGREMTRQEENQKSLYEFITMMEDAAVLLSMPKSVGNKTIAFLKKKA